MTEKEEKNQIIEEKNQEETLQQEQKNDDEIKIKDNFEIGVTLFLFIILSVTTYNLINMIVFNIGYILYFFLKIIIVGLGLLIGLFLSLHIADEFFSGKLKKNLQEKIHIIKRKLLDK